MKMTKKSKKRALISSLVVMAICFTMLIGSTFAWFTDSASSTGNVITTGTLDVKLTQKDANGNYTEVNGPVFDNVLWEPNATYVEYFRIENAGTLALKLGVALNVTDVTKNLNEVLEYAVVEGTTVSGWTSGTAVAVGNNVTTIDGLTLAPRATYDFALAVHMDHNAGNTYQDASITFDVNVAATQATYESDTFGDKYDAGAGVPTVATADEFVAALANGGEVALANDITLTSKAVITEDTVIYGNGNTITYTGSDRVITVENTTPDVNLTVSGLNIVTTGYSNRGINYNASGNLVVENCSITSENGRINYAISLPGSSANANVTIKNTTVDSYICVNVWGANSVVNVINCNFTSTSTTTDAASAIAVNKDSATAAEGAVINVTGGTIKAVYSNETTLTPDAIRSRANNVTVNVDTTATIIGGIDTIPSVANITYPGTTDFYTYTDIQSAINKVVRDNAGTIVLLADITVDTLEVNGNVTIVTNGYTFTYGTTTGTGTLNVQ